MVGNPEGSPLGLSSDSALLQLLTEDLDSASNEVGPGEEESPAFIADPVAVSSVLDRLVVEAEGESGLSVEGREFCNVKAEADQLQASLESSIWVWNLPASTSVVHCLQLIPPVSSQRSMKA